MGVFGELQGSGGGAAVDAFQGGGAASADTIPELDLPGRTAGDIVGGRGGVPHLENQTKEKKEWLQ